MSGIEIAKTAKRLHPEIKTVYTSGYSENPFKNGNNLGEKMTLLKKPFHRAELLETIRSSLDG